MSPTSDGQKKESHNSVARPTSSHADVSTISNVIELNRHLGALARRHSHLDRRIERLTLENPNSPSLNFDTDEFEGLSCAIPLLERYRAECKLGIDAVKLLENVLPFLDGKKSDQLKTLIQEFLREVQTYT